MLKQIGALFIVMLLMAGSAITASALDHSGTISEDETWLEADNPHVITGTVYVQHSVTPPTLTLEPGVIVQFYPGTSLNIGWNYAGKLNANGTATDPITFTSNQATPNPGDWNEICFRVDPSGSVLNYCVIEYGGGSSYNANVYLYSGGGVSITNSEIRYSLKYGVNVRDGARLSAFSDNTLSDNGLHPVNIYANYLEDLGTGNSYSGNNPDHIRVVGDYVTTTQTWLDPGIPLEVTGDIWIQAAANSIVTIDPGTTLVFNFNTGLFVGYSYAGGLIADGTVSEPITFTSVYSDAFPGDWDGIGYYGNTDDANAICDECIIEYAGGASGGLKGNVRVHNSFPSITNSTIRFSEEYGIYLADASGFTAFEGNEVSDNGLNPVRIYGEYVRTLGAGNIYNLTDAEITPYVNKYEEIRVEGDTIVTSGTWLDQGTPYRIAGNIAVQRSSTPFPVLTLSPGVTLRFSSNVHLRVGYSYVGTLVANGTPDAPITFTSWDKYHPTPGDWRGVELYSKSSSTSLDHTIIEYGGGNNYGNLYIRSSDVTVSRSVISNSAENGIYVYVGADPELSKLRVFENVNAGIRTTGSGTNPTITESTFQGNTYGIYATGSSNPIIGGESGLGNNFYHSRIYGVQNTTASITVNATNNWWGTDSGPKHPDNPGGTGDAVSDYIDFSSWRSRENPWVDIIDFWTSDLDNNKKKQFSPGEDIRYHLKFSYDNGKDIDSTIRMRGKLKGNTTSDGEWTHKLKKNISGSYMFHYQTWDKEIPTDAAIEDLKAKMKVIANRGKDKDTTKVKIVEP